MDYLHSLTEIILHPKVAHLTEVVQPLGPWVYVVLFLIIFCETGLVVMPFLPGDSLLFAVGVISALTGLINLPLILVLLIVAAVAGDALNYYLGYRAGPRIFSSESSWLFNKKHLLRAQEFYEKYGGKAIILARFVPIVRTFAPFVAGIGKMEYRRFALYNVVGAVVWVTSFTVAGYLLGAGYLGIGVETVEKNLHLITAAIVLISVAPIVVEYVLARRKKAVEAAAPAETVAARHD